MWQKYKIFWITFFKLVWDVIKSMNTLRGYIALFISFMIFDGWALLFIVFGSIAGNAWMIGIGTTVMLFWVGPGTPVIPLIIITALFIRRYILFEKKEHVNLKEKWIELNQIEKQKKRSDHKW